MGALDIITKALVVVAGIALTYFGLLNVVVPLVIAIPPRYRHVPDTPDQHVHRSALVNEAMGLLALVLGGALLSLVFEGTDPIESLATGVQTLGSLLLLLASAVAVGGIAILAGKFLHIDFSSRYWLLGIALGYTALEAYLIQRYVTQHDPATLISALICGFLMLLRWSVVILEQRRS